MSENDEERLLHEICRNSSMGREAIHEVLKDVYDEEFAYELHVQEGKMQEFEQRARQRLRQSGKDAAEPGPLTSGMLKAAVRMKTAVSGRTSQVAESSHGSPFSMSSGTPPTPSATRLSTAV